MSTAEQCNGTVATKSFHTVCGPDRLELALLNTGHPAPAGHRQGLRRFSVDEDQVFSVIDVVREVIRSLEADPKVKES
jgi:hypothetical protein